MLLLLKDKSLIQSLAIIIPSLNSPIIDQVVAALLSQEDVAFKPEVIIVGKDELGLIPLHSTIRFIDTNQPVNPATARNRGVAATNADLLVFLDSDCLPTSNWLSEHIAAHEAGHIVVSGSVRPIGINYWHLTYNLTLFHELLTFNVSGSRDFLATLNLSVDRQVLDKVGGMNEEINRVEDMDWTMRMRRSGIQPYFWPEAKVTHLHSRTNWQEVWKDCALSGYHMQRLRFQYQDLLEAPSLLRYRRLVWWLSPLIAAWATVRIIWKRPLLARRFWRTLPAIYLTKIAWCWGASRESEPMSTWNQ